MGEGTGGHSHINCAIERPQTGEEKGGEGQRQKGEGGGERSRGASYLCVSPPRPQLALPTGTKQEPVLQAGASPSHPKAAAHHPGRGSCPRSGTVCNPSRPLGALIQSCKRSRLAAHLQPQRRSHYLAGRRLPEGRSPTASGSCARRSCHPAGHLRRRAGGYLEPAESAAPQSPDQLCQGHVARMG